MAAFKGSDFEIQLPSEYSDESTYAFALPARSDFRPSVVIKTERLAQAVDLSAYVSQQLAKIQTLLENFKLVSSGPVKHDGLQAYGSVYDWGNPARWIRQKQRYLLLDDPVRVVTLTGTTLRDTFPEAEALFDAIFLSFKPVGP